MCKVKTHSGAKKRFSKKKSGAIKGAHAYRRHMLRKRTAKVKRDLRKPDYLCSSDKGHIAPLLPY